MAFDKWGRFNRETSVPLSIEYSKEPVATSTFGNTTSWFRYVRRATKSYSFKGMTEAAVKACLAEKRRQYARRMVSWQRYNTIPRALSARYDRFVNVAALNVVRREVVYDLQITVDETVEIYLNRDFDLNTESGCKFLENNFMRRTPCESYVWSYDYDETDR